MPTKDGRKMLHNYILKYINSNSASRKITINNYDSYLNILLSEFNLRFSEVLYFTNIPSLADKMTAIKQVSGAQLLSVLPKSVSRVTFFSQPINFPQNLYNDNSVAKAIATPVTFSKIVRSDSNSLQEPTVLEKERYKGYFHKFPKLTPSPIKVLEEKPKRNKPKITVSQYQKLTRLDQIVSSNFGEVIPDEPLLDRGKDLSHLIVD